MWKEKQGILCARLQYLVYLVLELRDDEDRYLPAGAHYMLVGHAPCRKKVLQGHQGQLLTLFQPPYHPSETVSGWHGVRLI